MQSWEQGRAGKAASLPFWDGFLELLGGTEHALTPQEVYFLQSVHNVVPIGNRLGYQTFFFVSTFPLQWQPIRRTDAQRGAFPWHTRSG
jgi:hypothetical protein